MMRRAWILFLLLLLPVADAWADYPATYAWVFGSQGTNPKWFDVDPPTACQKYATGAIGAGWICKNVTKNGSTWQGLIYTPSGSYSSDVQSVWRLVCTNGGTLSGATCVGADPPPPMCPPDKVGTYTWQITIGADGRVKGGPPIIGSDGQCEIKLTGVRYCYQGTDGKSYCKYDTVTTGNIRAPSAPDVPPAVSNPPGDVGNTAGSQQSPPLPGQPGGGCPKGMVNAGLDSSGIPICMGTGYDRPSTTTPTTTTSSAPTTTNNSDGSTTTTQNTTTTNADGTKTTVTTTVIKMPDGSTSQTQSSSTTARPDGTTGVSTGGSGSSTDKGNLCSENPNLTICQNSTVSGTCGEISCTGDAIQCATLRAAAALQCARQADEDGLKANASKTLGDAILGGTDPAKTTIDTLIKGDTADMSAPTLDQGGFVGGGSCLPDKTFFVMGHAVTVSFATVCSNIQPLRYIVMACAFILVYLMVARSVING